MSDPFVTYISSPLYSTLGLAMPASRFGVFFATGGLLFYLAKPYVMFDEDGNMRPWTVTDPSDSSATVLPLFVGASVIGLLGLLL